MEASSSTIQIRGAGGGLTLLGTLVPRIGSGRDELLLICVGFSSPSRYPLLMHPFYWTLVLACKPHDVNQSTPIDFWPQDRALQEIVWTTETCRVIYCRCR